MIVYYFVFVWLFVMVFLSNFITVTVEKEIDSKKVQRWKLLFAVILFAPVIYIAAFLQPRGDVSVYIRIYDNIVPSTEWLKNEVLSATSGQGFTVLLWLIKLAFGSNPVFFRFIIAVLHSLPIFTIFRLYSDDFPTSVFIFLATGNHIAWMMNGLRQYLAAVIIFVATPLLLKKKYIKFFIFVLLASTIHISALIMIPIVFVCMGKLWNKRLLLFLLATFILTIVFIKQSDLIDKFLYNTEYENVIENVRILGDNGTNPVRVLVSSVPMLFGIFFYEKLNKENSPMIVFCMNASVVTFGLYLISMVTSGIIIGRLPIYVSLYGYLLLPHILKKNLNEDSLQNIYAVMVPLYMIYYLVDYYGF